MQIQLNTDNHITGSTDLLERVQETLERQLRHVSETITRVEVHLNDVNSAKGGDADKRCMLEVRIAGAKPFSVEHRATTVDLAVEGAASQLARAIKTSLDKSNTQGKGGTSIKHFEQDNNNL